MSGEARETTDGAGWDEVLRRWSDDDAHRAFLAASPGLDGLAEAGRRYREVLERRPDDPVALRWRDEVLRRATALAFAQLPRTKPPPAIAATRLRRFGLAVGVTLAAGLALALLRAFWTGG